MGLKRKSKKKKSSVSSTEIEKEITLATDADEDTVTKKVMKHLPHLTADIARSESDVQIEGVRWEETDRTQQPITTDRPRFSSYSPDIVDFLRRCNTDEEASDVITFLENRGEITPAHARELRKQLQERGIRSFGSKKAWGHYEREG